MSRRDILITGAGGFVCSHLAQGLAAAGHRVTALDRSFDAPTRARLAGVRLLQAELDAQALARVPDPVDVVIHGAALTSDPAQLGVTPAAHIGLNMALLFAALEFAQTRGARYFVFISSSGVFEGQGGLDHLAESTPPEGRSAYALAKRMGEMALACLPADTMAGLTFRLGPVYGPSEAVRPSRLGTSLVRRALDMAAQGGPVTIEHPATRRDWTYAPDLARALDTILRAPQPVTGLIHLGSGEILTDGAVGQAVAQATGVAFETPDPQASLPRTPMTTERHDWQRGFTWTPFGAGLSDLMAQERSL